MTSAVDDNSGLGRSASRGAAVTLAGQGMRITVQLVGIVVLARLLTPSDFGLLAMVTAVIGIGEIFRDFGLSSAAIQSKTLSRGQRDNLFWINTGIGVVLAGVFLACSGLIGALYGDDRVQPLAALLSITFILNGLSTQYRADLTRNLRFVGLASVEITAQLLGVTAGILFALAGFGYWALAAQQIGISFVALVGLMIVTGWLPGRIDRDAPMRSFLNYGTSVLGAHVLGYAGRNVDTVIIGARFGAFDLGLYNRAFQLMMMPLIQLNAPSTRVALPVLSRLQDDRLRFARFVTFGQTAVLILVSSVFALLGSQTSAVVSLMLGDQWLASIPLFQILLIAGFFQAASYAVYWVFLSKGLTRANLQFAIVTRPIVIAMVIVGSNWGVYGVAWAYTLSMALSWPAGLIWIARISDAPAAQMFWNGVRTISIFGVATGTSYLSTLALPEDMPVLRIAVGLVVVALTVLLIAALWPRFRSDLLALARARRYFGPKGSSPAAGEDLDDTGETKDLS